MRGDAAFSTETAKSLNRPVILAALELRCDIGDHATESACSLAGGTWTPPIYLTSHAVDVDFDGNTYLATNDWLGITEIIESAGLQIGSVTANLSAIDQSYTALLLQQNYIDKPVTLHHAFLNDGGEVTTAVQIYKGGIARALIQDEVTEASISIEIKNHLAAFDRRVGRRTNNAENQRYYPGDTSMSHADEGFREMPWGRVS
ncbi:MAG: hypothetical protein AAF542_17820 [Pseudomonadota bacterium]